MSTRVPGIMCMFRHTGLDVAELTRALEREHRREWSFLQVYRAWPRTGGNEKCPSQLAVTKDSDG